MLIIQSPKVVKYKKNIRRLFLAGGISNCPDWQEYVCEKMKPVKTILPIEVYNPRRSEGLCMDGNDARIQIEWEHKCLSLSTHMLFWFPCETLCPITLFELGKYAPKFSKFNVNPRLFVGMHPDYQRRFDLEVQLPLIIPNIKLYYDIDELTDAVIGEIK